jgi:hypothetical protein
MLKRLAFAFTLLAFRASGEESPKPPAEPRLLSVYPSAIRAGATTQVSIRGTSLTGARAVFFKHPRLTGRVIAVDKDDTVRIELASEAETGSYPVRVVTPRGVSNEVSVQVVAEEIRVMMGK